MAHASIFGNKIPSMLNNIIKHPSTPEILTSREAAQYLRFNRFSLYRHCRNGSIPHIRVNSRTIRFRRADLDRWLNSRTV